MTQYQTCENCDCYCSLTIMQAEMLSLVEPHESQPKHWGLCQLGPVWANVHRTHFCRQWRVREKAK